MFNVKIFSCEFSQNLYKILKYTPILRGVNSKIHPNFSGVKKIAKYLKIKDINTIC